MEKEHQIEEMANDIAAMCPDLVDNGCGDLSCVACLARGLEQMGYRKQSEPFPQTHENGGGWISVEERMPEESGWYLVNIFVPFSLDFMNLSHYSKVYGWNNPATVTHWMHLPEAPKMKGGAE